MPTKVEHNLEHAEHAQHHAHDPFDKRVAMTIAIVAAFLALVTTLSHRGHTDVLRLQIEANILNTDATDKWAFYQAKNIRQHQYQTFLEFLPVVAKAPGTEPELERARKNWTEMSDKYKVELPDMRKEAEQLHARAKAKTDESHHLHQKVNRYDVGEVGIEISMVLCSIAVLTKRRAYWLTGITCGVIGVAIVASGYFEIGLSHGGHETAAHSTIDAHAPAKAPH